MKPHPSVILAALALLAGCAVPNTGALDESAPFPNLKPGSDAEPLTSSLSNSPPFAIACGGVTFFAGDDGYSRCSEARDFIAIYRVGSQQYAYIVHAETITKIRQSNHTVTYP